MIAISSDGRWCKMNRLCQDDLCLNIQGVSSRGFEKQSPQIGLRSSCSICKEGTDLGHAKRMPKPQPQSLLQFSSLFHREEVVRCLFG